MDSESHSDADITSHLTTNDSGSTSYRSGLFSGCQYFTVTGQTLTNITNNYTTAPAVPPDFKTIPLGDIYLQDEIGSDRARIVGRRGTVRRLYTARVVGLGGNMTVAMYRGENAEKKWREDITRYSLLRHPYFMQLCGLTTSSTMHAAVFHDDLIALEHFFVLYQHSPILTVYLHGCCNTEFWAACKYFYSAFQRALTPNECTFFIRRSTGRLCADLIPANCFHWLSSLSGISRPQGIMDTQDQEAMVIDSLTIEEFHEICYWDLSRCRNISTSNSVTVNLGGVIICSSDDQLQDWVEIVSLPDVKVYGGRWWGAEGEVMGNGRTRFNSGDVLNSTLSAQMWCLNSEYWLSQANHIFNRLQVTSHFENYLVVDDVYFQIQISATMEDCPSSYLFLCPETDFCIGMSSVRWPACPAYWSFDPAGVERLSTEEATGLGLPSIRCMIKVCGYSWDASVYAGLRQFHQGKGFGPDSQKVARYRGEPLYRISTEIYPSFTHVDPDYPGSEEDDQSDSSNLYDDIPPLLFLL